MSDQSENAPRLNIAIPKGRLYENIVSLLDEAGLSISRDGRNYRPTISDPDLCIKILKPQNIPSLVKLGSQDIGFVGHDWVVEQSVEDEVEELLDLEFDPVTIVAAIPHQIDQHYIKNNTIRVASEYEQISRQFLKKQNIDHVFIRSYGATEVFVPDDADMIIDNTSTGRTLRANNLKIFDEVLRSSTRMIAHREALEDDWKARKIKHMIILINSVLAGRKRVLIEMNVVAEKMDYLLPHLPCIKSPTVAKLYGDQGYAVKIAVERNTLPELIPFLKEHGATDILVFSLDKLIP